MVATRPSGLGEFRCERGCFRANQAHGVGGAYSAGLGACSLLQGNLFDDSFWASSPFQVNDEAELGIANLAKGNYVAAEGNFQKGLKRNPKDVHALLGSGILCQNTG